jgi:hypothetical protein
MSGLVIFLVAMVAIFVLDVLAQTHGVDSRPEFDDARAPACGISV